MLVVHWGGCERIPRRIVFASEFRTVFGSPKYGFFDSVGFDLVQQLLPTVRLEPIEAH